MTDRVYPMANIDPDYTSSPRAYCQAILYLRDASKIQARCRDVWGHRTPTKLSIQRWIDRKYPKPKLDEQNTEIGSFRVKAMQETTDERARIEREQREKLKDEEILRLAREWKSPAANPYVDPIGIPRKVAAQVEFARGLIPHTIIADGRMGNVAKARQLVYYLLTTWGMSTNAIGRAIGRDHTSVIHGLKRAKDIIATDPMAALLVEAHLKMQDEARLIQFQRSMQVREWMDAA